MKKDYKTPRKTKLQIFYKSIEAVLDHFDNEECGLIFRAAFNYEMYGGERPQMNDRSQQIVIDRICDDFDNLLEAYLRKCEQNRDNANSRWSSEKNNSRATLSLEEASDIVNEIKSNANERDEYIAKLNELKLPPADKALVKSLLNKK